ncbi:hypothetical protein ACVI3U_000247 [Sinorhizobium medicae]
MQDRKGAVCLPRGSNGGFDRCEGGNVRGNGDRLAAFFRNDRRRFPGGLDVEVDACDLGALARIKHGGRLAVPPAGAGGTCTEDDCRFSSKTVCHSKPRKAPARSRATSLIGR